jgi:hypothetical protein
MTPPLVHRMERKVFQVDNEEPGLTFEALRTRRSDLVQVVDEQRRLPIRDAARDAKLVHPPC